MIDAMAVLIILGFIGTIGTTAGMAFWLDRQHSARMDRIDKRLDDQGVLQRAMQIDLAEVKSELKAQVERLDRQDSRFDRQDERFDRIDKRLDDQGEFLRAMGSALSAVQTELEEQGKRLDRQDARFDSQDARFDRIDERFERQSFEINAVGRKVDRVEGMVYVLIHGPDYRERGLGIEEAREEEVSEPVGDD